MRKLLFLLLILLLLAAGLWWTSNFFALFGGKKATFKHLPASTLAVFHTSNVQNLISEVKDGEQWEELKEFDWIARFADLQEQVALLFKGEKSKIKKVPVTASLHLTAPQEYDYLLHFNTSSLNWFRLRYFIDKVEEKGFTLEKRTFNGIAIFEVKGEQLKRPIILAQTGGVLLVSHEATLVEEAVNESTPNIEEAALEALNVYQSEDLFTAYFHLKNLPYLNTIFTLADKATLFNYLENSATGMVLTGKRVGEEQNWNIHGNWVWKKGQESPNNQLSAVFKQNLGQAQTLKASDIMKLIPSNVALLIHEQQSRKTEAAAVIQKDYENFIDPWLGTEWAWFIPERQEGDLGSCLLVKTKEPIRARNIMNRWFEESGGVEAEVNYRNFPLKHLSSASLAQLFLGDLGKEHFEDSWFALIEDYVLLATDKTTLQAVLDQQISGQTLAREDFYKKQLAESVSIEGAGVFIQPNYLLPTLKLNPSDQFEKELKSKSSNISKFSPMFFVFGPEKINGVIKYGETYEASSVTLWNAVLDAPPVSRPQIIQNDVTDKNEIFVQDAKDILYMLNAEGQIEWKSNLGGAVMGEIHLVNLYNNQERQYLFNTRNEIYMLDSRGDLVQNFPLRLSTPTQTGMLFYEDNIYIPCENEQIYGYSISGKLLNGWNPNEEVVGVINQPLTILEQKENWFLLAANESGTVTALNRFGELEFVSILGSPLLSPLEIDLREGFYVAIATCQDGKTYTINQEGTYWSKNYLPLDSTATFLTENILSSEAEELVFANKQFVSIFNPTEKLKEFNLGCPISDIFTTEIEGLSSKRMGAFCEEMQQAWLFDYDKVYEGFPITTTTPFVVTDLYNTDENFVIAGGQSNDVFAFRIK